MRISINGVGYDENDVPRALAMDALEAINFTVLSTTVRDMARAAEVVAAHQRCGGTKWRNHHPVMLLCASAISRITSESLGHTGNAGYEAAKKLCRLVAGEDWRGAQEQPGPISDSEVQKRMRFRPDRAKKSTGAISRTPPARTLS